METADIVIAGAGFAGATTAYRLAKRGVKNIFLLEPEAVPGFHASGRNASLTFQLLSDPQEARLALEGTQFIATPPNDFCGIPLLRRSGSLLLAERNGISALEKSYETAQVLGLHCEILPADRAMNMVPPLADARFELALWNPNDGVVDVKRLLQCFLDGARLCGVVLEYERTITAVQVERGRIAGVETNQGPIATRMLVNAGGAWAGEIGRMAGVGARTLAPRRRHMYQLQVGFPTDPSWPFAWHNDLDVYFRPEGTGLLCSPCDATPHPPLDPQVDPAVEPVFRDKLHRAFPALVHAHVTKSWACLRTFARDERFVIGRDPEIEGFVWVAALGGHGVTTSPAVGRLGAAAVLGERLPELDYFSPGRLTLTQ
ncbi:MAG TPA: FAD-binding oxidoreductase [Candidatus Acidoferrales bacterium]|nr:FAD-binding oxidoreductase [Candidatus Acidoferrales bacterium]